LNRRRWQRGLLATRDNLDTLWRHLLGDPMSIGAFTVSEIPCAKGIKQEIGKNQQENE
jgi:hypothetical protein